MLVKEKISILRSYWFEIHGSTVTSTLTQNLDYLPIVSWGKPHIDLNLGKSQIQSFMQIAI